MILNTKYSSQTSFGVTFKSANQADYPIIYSEDEWHVAKKDSDLCALYDGQNNKTTSETGANFTQGEVNETLSRAIADVNENINDIKNNITNVYHYKGTVETVDSLKNITSVSVGDVYNVRSTGMNYAYTDETAKKIYTAEGDIITGKGLVNIVKENNQNNPYVTEMNINGKVFEVNIVGGYAYHTLTIYAFLTSNQSKDGTYYSGGDFVDLDSYDSKKGYYTATTDTVKVMMLDDLSRWDALGSTIDWTPTWEE